MTLERFSIRDCVSELIMPLHDAIVGRVKYKLIIEKPNHLRSKSRITVLRPVPISPTQFPRDSRLAIGYVGITNTHIGLYGMHGRRDTVIDLHDPHCIDRVVDGINSITCDRHGGWE